MIFTLLTLLRSLGQINITLGDKRVIPGNPSEILYSPHIRSGVGETWIGAHNHRWTDGSKMTYTGSGLFTLGMNCAVISMNGYKVAGKSCVEKHSYFCKKPCKSITF